jgi:hypothetical protein
MNPTITTDAADGAAKSGAIELSKVDGEARVEDVVLARWLEYERVGKLRELIQGHEALLKRQGLLPRKGEKIEGRGRPRKSYWLNKKQAIFVAAKSDKPKGQEILLMLVDVFDAAERMALEKAAESSWIFRKVFLEIPEHTEYLWTPERLGPIAALYGVSYTGGRPPVETKRIQREIYDLVVGSGLIHELREKYPDPPGEKGTPYIYDHFAPEVRAAVEVELGKVAAIAKGSGTIHHFRAQLKSIYGTSMLQLVFGGKDVSKWLLPPTTKGDNP